MRMVRVGGVWLRTIGAWTDLTVSHEYPRGCREASWRMKPDLSHPALIAGALVEVFDTGQRVWRGRLTEPPLDGQFSANGSWSEAADILALNAGAATNTPDTAIDDAISRGAVSWTRPASLSAVAWGTPGQPMRLLELLDAAMAGLNKRWWVDPDGAIRAAADPTTPTLYVPQAVSGRGLTLADDEYFSHIVGTYLLAGPTYATLTRGSTAASTKWRRKEAFVDLTPMGVITTPTATTELDNRLALSGARMGFAENLNLGKGEITTPGGTPVSLYVPRATTRDGGLMVRLMGVTDRTRASADLPYTDIVIARTEYTDGASTVQLVPMGKAPRDLTEILTVQLGEAA